MKENTLSPIDEFTDPMRNPPVEGPFGKWAHTVIVQGGPNSKRFTIVSGSGFGELLSDIAMKRGLKSTLDDHGDKCTTTTTDPDEKDAIIEVLVAAGDKDERGGVPIGRPASVNSRPNKKAGEGGYTRGWPSKDKMSYVDNIPEIDI